MIQAIYRSRLVRNNINLFKFYAGKVQKFMRGYWARKILYSWYQAALKIQSKIRYRNDYNRFRIMVASANIITKRYRVVLKKLTDRMQAAVHIQAFTRRRSVMHRFKRMLKSANIILQGVRSFLKQLKVIDMYLASRLMQCTWRGHFIRLERKRLKENHCSRIRFTLDI